MDWPNERYIRLYTRDSGDWLMWPWQTRALLTFILRKVDRAGLLHLGKGKLHALAAILSMPSQDVTEWIAPLLEDGCVQIRDGVLCVPNFVPAQEATQSDRARQQASRERARARFLSDHGETKESPKVSQVPDPPADQAKPSRAVTPRHEPSQSVTPSLAKPSLAEPERERVRAAPPSVEAESGYDLALRVFTELWSEAYAERFEPSTDMSKTGDDRCLQRIGAMAKRTAEPEATLRGKLAAFLADRSEYKVGRRHAVQLLEQDWSSLGSRLPPSGVHRVPVQPVAKAGEYDWREKLSPEQRKAMEG
jgi:hypothetical protein